MTILAKAAPCLWAIDRRRPLAGLERAGAIATIRPKPLRRFASGGCNVDLGQIFKHRVHRAISSAPGGGDHGGWTCPRASAGGRAARDTKGCPLRDVRVGLRVRCLLAGDSDAIWRFSSPCPCQSQIKLSLFLGVLARRLLFGQAVPTIRLKQQRDANRPARARASAAVAQPHALALWAFPCATERQAARSVSTCAGPTMAARRCMSSSIGTAGLLMALHAGWKGLSPRAAGGH